MFGRGGDGEVVAHTSKPTMRPRMRRRVRTRNLPRKVLLTTALR